MQNSPFGAIATAVQLAMACWKGFADFLNQQVEDTMRLVQSGIVSQSLRTSFLLMAILMKAMVQGAVQDHIGFRTGEALSAKIQDAIIGAELGELL